MTVTTKITYMFRLEDSNLNLHFSDWQGFRIPKHTWQSSKWMPVKTIGFSLILYVCKRLDYSTPPQKKGTLGKCYRDVIVCVFILRAKLRSWEDPTLGLSKKPSQSVLRCHNCLQQETVNSEYTTKNDCYIAKIRCNLWFLAEKKKHAHGLTFPSGFWEYIGKYKIIHLWHFRWLPCHLPPFFCKPKDVLWNDQGTCIQKIKHIISDSPKCQQCCYLEV